MLRNVAFNIFPSVEYTIESEKLYLYRILYYIICVYTCFLRVLFFFFFLYVEGILHKTPSPCYGAGCSVGFLPTKTSITLHPILIRGCGTGIFSAKNFPATTFELAISTTQTTHTIRHNTYSKNMYIPPNVGLEPTTLRLRVSCSTD